MTALPDPPRRLAVGAPTNLPLIRIPPFPGARTRCFTPLSADDGAALRPAEITALLRSARVGGCFWGAQPALPDRCLLIRSNREDPAIAALVADSLGPVVAWGTGPGAAAGDCDPWHMLRDANGLVCEAHDEARLIAGLLGVPTYVASRTGLRLDRDEWEIGQLFAAKVLLATRFSDPFGGAPLSLSEVIDLCGFWRRLIDSNRDIGGAIGFAFWKRKTVLPLLWDGGDSSGFFRDRAPEQVGKGSIALWRSKASTTALGELNARAIRTTEVEDGFLRSTGLGADCIPPLSIAVDRLGPYFDPAQPSELEHMLEHNDFDPGVIDRARVVRDLIVAAGLGKYGSSKEVIARYVPDRRHILVPGQVEDDRSVITGGCGMTSNQQLLERVRASAPDAFIIYKPHPDVVAGHRKGVVPDRICRLLADIVVTDRPISALIDMVDEVHVNTSLAGFEALMRHKNVTTHGVPFYSGWGLTTDLGPVPLRRTRRRSLDELVAATLLLYPRYLDPLSGLPCPAEVVVDRLSRGATDKVGMLVRLRRLEGRVRACLARWTAQAAR